VRLQEIEERGVAVGEKMEVTLVSTASSSQPILATK
jgi:hypothetical protein